LDVANVKHYRTVGRSGDGRSFGYGSDDLPSQDHAGWCIEASRLAAHPRPGGIQLDRFHDVIRVVMGWEDYHMHVFSTASGD
jgi:hypothetical protein